MHIKGIRQLIRILYGKFMDMSIRFRILLFYLILLVFTVIVSSFIYQTVYYGIMLGRVSELSMETLYSIDQNINTMLDNVSIYSKLIITNDDIRRAISRPEPDAVASIGKNLQSFMETVPVISSVYIFDYYGHNYVLDREQSKSLTSKDVTKASWYKSAIEKKGGYILRLDCGGFIRDRNGKNFVSFIRTFNDVYSQKPVGVLIINLSEDNFANAYQVLTKKYNTSFILLDSENKNIVSYGGIEGLDKGSVIRTAGSKASSSHTEKIKGKEYLISYLSLQKQNWSIVSAVPMSEMLRDSRSIYFIAIIIFIINAILLFAGSILISRMITNPIGRLLKSMEGIEKGQFELADIRTGKDEIGKLREGYNLMVSQIQSLIGKVMEEQKIKRMTELNALQAQIKPHFLYNTFDAISFLALSGRSREVYEVISALGNYYRTSLSKGSEIITVNQEIDTVKNYLFIQKVRYGSLFSDGYDIDEEAGLCKIPKLVLQPLVENALYHGIKPKGENGTIRISARNRVDHIELAVEDDGVGMSEEQISKILNGVFGNGETGFGLRGTIERLKIYFNLPDICQIISKVGQGTRIELRIPLGGEYRDER